MKRKQRLAHSQGLLRFCVSIILLFSYLLSPAQASSSQTLALVSGESQVRSLARAFAQTVTDLSDTEECQKIQRCRTPELRIVPEASASAEAALRKLTRGLVPLGLLPYSAFLDQQGQELQLLASLPAQPLQVLVRADAPAQAMAQLAGGRVALGNASSIAAPLLAVMGLPLRALQLSRLSDASVQRLALRSGKLDAVVYWGQELPAPLAQALAQGEVRRLFPSKGELQQLRLSMPKLPLHTLPDAQGVSQRLPAVPLLLVTHRGVSERVVQALAARLRLLAAQDPQALQLTGESIVPWHSVLNTQSKETLP